MRRTRTPSWNPPATALRWAALALALAWSAAGRAAEPFAQGLLWQLDKPGARPSWVFGTLHSNDPRVIALPAPVARAFAHARTLAMEISWSDFEDAYFFDAMQFDDGRRLAALIGEEAYFQLRQALGSTAPADEVLARTKPWGALLRVTAARRASEAPTLDHGLWVAARERRLTIIGLETIEEQVAAFDSIPLTTQIALLRHALAHRADLEAQSEPTIQAWLRGDLTALARLDPAAAGDDAELRRHYAVLTQQLVVNRSALMAYRLFLPLRRGGVFVAVGALHLLGEDGLLAQLRTQGYHLRRLY
ncbi:MAG TPA: TraB/GumN family protein [Casimicrobiaceae bacterium]|jgi:hypothetical protein|nr:TraB/GumN family protein [Casimicrobiaceae bacterium]